MNEVKLQGKVKKGTFEKTFEEQYKWWNFRFILEDCYLMDVPIKCYVCCDRREPPEDLEGKEVVVDGHLCSCEVEISGEIVFSVQVNHIYNISTAY